MFAVMWSEHCGYKYSRPVLAAFKKYKEALEGAGLENAGIVDIGNGLGVTMKVESHNHPSAVEPYQGAATGVGGIIRDILTMGARPIACLNSLRFGPLEAGAAPDPVVDRNHYLFEHVVSGIAGYGNCVGVPTVAGEVSFHPRYSGNPLVNAMCVGILELSELTTAAATGPGNAVIYLGSATGRDGIHGATFASESLDDESDAKRPNVQIGDPFAEKLLIEATLEALATGAIAAIQDMGAAGLTCSTIEMSSKGGVGMEIDLDLVPMRESDMSGYELMLSESQERMLAVAHPNREQQVLDVFHKWGLKAVVIGHVQAERIVRVRRSGEVIASVDPVLLTDHCPVYTMDAQEPAYFREAANWDPSTLPKCEPAPALLKLLASPEIASKRWVYRQYDQSVQTQTWLRPGQADAAVLAPRGTKKGLAVKIDGNARQVYLHPGRGGRLAVAEAARNVACTGARPVAVTDGLNFGSPEESHVYWQFREAVLGIAEAAEIMETPVISGNVSFYNQSELGEVPPTPLVGMLGLLDSADNAIGLSPALGSVCYLIEANVPKDPQHGLGASAYASLVCGVENGYPAATDLSSEHSLCRFLEAEICNGAIVAAHDSSEGGLAVALAEMCIAARLGIAAVFRQGASFASALFGEMPGRVLVALPGSSDDVDSGAEVASRAEQAGLRATRVGTFVDSNEVIIDIGDTRFEWGLNQLCDAYENGLEWALSSTS